MAGNAGNAGSIEPPAGDKEHAGRILCSRRTCKQSEHYLKQRKKMIPLTHQKVRRVFIQKARYIALKINSNV